jgi:hemoglobin
MTGSSFGNDATVAAPLYQRVGGAEGVKQLVEVFYDLIEQHPEGHLVNILHLRGHGVAHSRIEQFNFLSGFLGGPNLYAEKYGHSNVRLMHEHVEINAAAKDAWLTCMSMAIDQIGISEGTKSELMANFKVVAEILVNRND